MAIGASATQWAKTLARWFEWHLAPGLRRRRRTPLAEQHLTRNSIDIPVARDTPSNIQTAYEMLRAEVMGLDQQRTDSSRLIRAPAVIGGAVKPSPADDIFMSLNGQPNSQDLQVLDSVLNSMKDAVIIVNTAGICLFSNLAAQAMLAKHINTTPLDRWVADFGLWKGDNATPYRWEDLPLAQALNGAVVQGSDIYVRRRTSPTGDLFISASATPLRDGSLKIRGAIGVLTDLTERRKTEGALNHAKEEAEQANRAKSEFVSRMSHELRTPLNAILGFAQLLGMAKLQDHDRDSVEQILNAGRHLLELINEVLDIARIESGRLSLALERVSSLDAVQEAVTLVEAQAAKGHIQLYIEAGPAWRLPISADRQRFKQVVLNLLSNAVKYNRAGGSVRISAEARNARLKVTVTDTGRGIAKDKLSLLFNPFERLSADSRGIEGTGIGLALSKRLTEAMSGRIGVESEEGCGTAFWIEFGTTDAAGSDKLATNGNDLERLSQGIVSNRSAVVLCIEDNDSNFRLIERTLAYRPQIKLIWGKLGGSALPLAEVNFPDLILLDMHLPDFNGAEVLKILKNNPITTKVPVVVVSADATPLQRERMLEGGASDYLTKPLDISKLLEVVDAAIGTAADYTIPCQKN